MTDEEASKILWGKMGVCPHEHWEQTRWYVEYNQDDEFTCQKCGKVTLGAPGEIPNLITPDGFIQVIGWARKQEWWEKFMWAHSSPRSMHLECLTFDEIEHYPDFLMELAEWLEKEERWTLNKMG